MTSTNSIRSDDKLNQKTIFNEEQRIYYGYSIEKINDPRGRGKLALIFSLLGFLLLPFTPLVGVIMAHMEIKKAKIENYRNQRAVSALILGYFSLALHILALILLASVAFALKDLWLN